MSVVCSVSGRVCVRVRVSETDPRVGGKEDEDTLGGFKKEENRMEERKEAIEIKIESRCRLSVLQQRTRTRISDEIAKSGSVKKIKLLFR
jgi:hypothetical protein